VVIIPEGKEGKVLEEHEYWVAKIRDIRARSPTEVLNFPFSSIPHH
jgi:hypothetical protein